MGSAGSEVLNTSYRGEFMWKGGDDGLRTVECLRGRLLSERVASKAAKDEAELMTKRLAELERQVAEEIKYRNRAEKRLKYALKKLESLKLLDASGQLNLSESSPSSSSNSSYILESRKSTADFRRSASGGEVEQTPRRLGLENVIGEESSGNFSSDNSAHQLVSQEGSWSSVGTAHSHNKEAPHQEGSNGDQQELISDAVRQSSLNGDESDNAIDHAKHYDNTLALVPVSTPPRFSAYDPEIKNNNNVHNVLVALRHVKEQLRNSMGRRAVAASSHRELCGHWSVT